MGRHKGGGSSYGLRRRSCGTVVSPVMHNTVELLMECFDEALSPSQIEAAKKAKEDYRKAMKMIETAKAEAAISAAAASMAQVAFKISDQDSISPDIMIVGETPPRPGQKRAASHPTSPAQPDIGPRIQPFGAPLVPVLPGSGVVPQQVYRFVNYSQNNATGNVQQNQWFLRPLMPVMPQKQVQARGSSPIVPRAISPAPTPPAPTPPAPTPPAVAPIGSIGALSMPIIVSGTSGLGIKRPMNADPEYQPSPASKKPRSRPSTDVDVSGTGGGNWVPLDEYYYGKMEGDPTYTEEKAEFRFKCWMCTKMLYNNVKAMMHLQGHIDSEKQQNLDLSDLTQCKHCYKQFDTPFEMQTHIEKVHMNNVNVLMCRICEKDHESRSALTTHMRQNHCACEMPYICQLCNFRSSMYSDVVDHFKKKHDSADSMLCLYCLRVFHIKFVSQGWGQTQTYYHHLLRHQSRASNRKCTFCKLSFFNPQDLKLHRKANHQPNQKGVIGVNAKYNTPDQVMIKVPEAGIMPKKSSGPKSLNAPTSTKVTEHRGLRMPSGTAVSYCFECKMLMNTVDHYRKYILCSMCRFATSCSFAYASHMMGFHSGQAVSLAQAIPSEKAMAAPLFCLCGFSSKFGNRIANHLVFCSKRTCYLEKPEVPPADKLLQDDQIDPRHKPGASILDVLGLVKKQSVVNTSAEDDDVVGGALGSHILAAESSSGPSNKVPRLSTYQKSKPAKFHAVPVKEECSGTVTNSHSSAHAELSVTDDFSGELPTSVAEMPAPCSLGPTSAGESSPPVLDNDLVKVKAEQQHSSVFNDRTHSGESRGQEGSGNFSSLADNKGSTDPEVSDHDKMVIDLDHLTENVVEKDSNPSPKKSEIGMAANCKEECETEHGEEPAPATDISAETEMEVQPIENASVVKDSAKSLTDNAAEEVLKAQEISLEAFTEQVSDFTENNVEENESSRLSSEEANIQPEENEIDAGNVVDGQVSQEKVETDLRMESDKNEISQDISLEKDQELLMSIDEQISEKEPPFLENGSIATEGERQVEEGQEIAVGDENVVVVEDDTPSLQEGSTVPEDDTLAAPESTSPGNFKPEAGEEVNQGDQREPGLEEGEEVNQGDRRESSPKEDEESSQGDWRESSPKEDEESSQGDWRESSPKEDEVSQVDRREPGEEDEEVSQGDRREPGEEDEEVSQGDRRESSPKEDEEVSQGDWRESSPKEDEEVSQGDRREPGKEEDEEVSQGDWREPGPEEDEEVSQGDRREPSPVFVDASEEYSKEPSQEELKADETEPSTEDSKSVAEHEGIEGYSNELGAEDCKPKADEEGSQEYSELSAENCEPKGRKEYSEELSTEDCEPKGRKEYSEELSAEDCEPNGGEEYSEELSAEDCEPKLSAEDCEPKADEEGSQEYSELGAEDCEPKGGEEYSEELSVEDFEPKTSEEYSKEQSAKDYEPAFGEETRKESLKDTTKEKLPDSSAVTNEMSSESCSMEWSSAPSESVTSIDDKSGEMVNRDFPTVTSKPSTGGQNIERRTAQDKSSPSSGSSQSRSYQDRERQHSRDRGHSSSHSDHRERDRDYKRDHERHDRDHHDRYRQHDRHRDQRYESHRDRYQQGSSNSRDRYHDQNRHSNQGGQGRHGYQDRNYHRGYY